MPASISPTYPIVAAGQTLTFTGEGIDGISIDGSWGNVDDMSLSVESSATTGSYTVTGTYGGSPVLSTTIYVVPAAVASNKNILLYGGDSNVYLISQSTSGGTPTMYGPYSMPSLIAGNVGGAVTPTTYINPSVTVTYITCVIANLPSTSLDVG